MRSLKIGVIPARAGSKGFPGKNLAPIDGVPLYLLAVRQSSRTCDLTLLSTDIDQGSLPPLPEDTILHRRSAANSMDHTSMSEVLEEIVKSLKPREANIVLLQPTSPLRADIDVISAVSTYETNQFNIVMSVSEVDNTIFKCGTISGGRFNALRQNSDCFRNRQSLPKAYRPNGAVYVFNSSWFIGNNYTLNDENIGTSLMPKERSYDIDTENDYNNILKILQAK